MYMDATTMSRKFRCAVDRAHGVHRQARETNNHAEVAPAVGECGTLRDRQPDPPPPTNRFWTARELRRRARTTYTRFDVIRGDNGFSGVYPDARDRAMRVRTNRAAVVSRAPT